VAVLPGGEHRLPARSAARWPTGTWSGTGSRTARRRPTVAHRPARPFPLPGRAADRDLDGCDQTGGGDPFAPTEVRKVERTLIVEYRAVIGRALDALTPANADIVRERAEFADMVRDYEIVQLRNVTGSRATVDELLASMTGMN